MPCTRAMQSLERLDNRRMVIGDKMQRWWSEYIQIIGLKSASLNPPVIGDDFLLSGPKQILGLRFVGP